MQSLFGNPRALLLQFITVTVAFGQERWSMLTSHSDFEIVWYYLLSHSCVSSYVDSWQGTSWCSVSLGLRHLLAFTNNLVTGWTDMRARARPTSSDSKICAFHFRDLPAFHFVDGLSDRCASGKRWIMCDAGWTPSRTSCSLSLVMDKLIVWSDSGVRETGLLGPLTSARSLRSDP